PPPACRCLPAREECVSQHYSSFGFAVRTQALTNRGLMQSPPRFASSLDLRLIFGIHRFGAAASSLAWKLVRICKFCEKRIGTRQVMRDYTLSPDDFLDGLARIGTDLASNYILVLASANHRFG